MKLTFKHTIYACYLGYITQAIVVNLAPLLFVTFQNEFGLSLDQIGLLVSLNFFVQLLTDLIAARYVDRWGYRAPVVVALGLSALGLFMMGVLPLRMDPYRGLMVATVLMAVGGGLIEVLISPIVESCPGDRKAAAMSLLHSFYCWGQVAVVLLSTGYFAAAGLGNWHVLPMLWALVPVIGLILFLRVPLRVLVEEHERVPLKSLFRVPVFWLLLLLMIGSGAAEQAMAQWCSLFAEIGLHMPKELGDLLGPLMFALLMGAARVLFGIFGARTNLTNALMLSAALCIASYLVAVFSPYPLLSLGGCALCGFSVGVMWPGTLSLAAGSYPQGGAAMFAVLAFAGDVGCSSGPGLVGLLSDRVVRGGLGFLRGWFPNAGSTEAGLRVGLICSIAFPLLILLGVYWLRRARSKEKLPQ